MSWLRDMLILVLIGFYLVMALASEAAPLPFKSQEEWVVTVGHSLPEQMAVVRGTLKQRKTWFIEYKVGERLAGHKLLLADYFQNFEKDLREFLRLSSGAKGVQGMDCAMPVLIHHWESGKIKRNEICPSRLSAADQLKFGDWFRRWQNLVTQDLFF